MAEEPLQGLTYNATFNPYQQMLTITMPDGIIQSVVEINNIWQLQNTAVDTGIIFGVQLGISVVLMLILAIMTRPEKRRSIIFCLNLGSLVLLFIRAIIMCVNLHGPFYNFYNWTTGYYRNVEGSIRLSVAADVINFLIIAGLEFSLFFQVRIVCVTLRTRWRLLVTAGTTLMAMAVCTIRFVTMIVNSDLGIVNVASKTDEQWALISALASASNICTIASIFFFSAIFNTKLGHAIYQRRSMGMKQFGPMQIIFVMGCQTMFIPGRCINSDLWSRIILTCFIAIFGILTYFVYGAAQVNSLMPCVVATFLPLSSMWAATNTNNINIAAPHQVKRNREIVIGPRTTSNTGGSGRQQSEKELVSDDTLIGEDSPRKETHDEIDLEMQNVPGHVHVDRTYSVRSD